MSSLESRVFFCYFAPVKRTNLMNSFTPFQIGSFTCTPIDAGDMWLDGGAMFGVVPYTLWSKAIEHDERLRIPMTMRCLLIESSHTGHRYLIDNGIGTKYDAKKCDIYGIPYGADPLMESLTQAGVDPSEITHMVFSHLHFDHCGGTTAWDSAGTKLEHRFPNAQFVVNERHWAEANSPNARETASFLRDNIAPIGESGRLVTVQDNHEFEPGFDVLNIDGHTIGQQLPRISDDSYTVVYAADLFPTVHHVPVPWVMGYDMRPTVTLTEKAQLCATSVQQEWIWFMEHDAHHVFMTIQKDDRDRYKGVPLGASELPF